MSPRGRTFCFILIFITLNLQNGPALCQTVGPGIPQSPVPLPREFSAPSGTPNSQLLNTLLTIASANGVLPNVLPAIQRIFPETQNLATNEGITQPLAQDVSNGRPCQPSFTPNLCLNTNLTPLPQSNLGINNPYPAPPKSVVNEVIPADITNGRSCQQFFTPNLVVTNPSPYPILQANLAPNPPQILPSYPILPPAALSPYPIPSLLPLSPTFVSPPFIPQQAPSIPAIPITDQSCNSLGPAPIMGPVGPPSVKQGDIFPPNCNLQPEIIQPQLNFQVPQMLPPAFPITRPPVLSIPSNPLILPPQSVGYWPYLSETNTIPISSPIEVPVTNVGSNINTASGCAQQLPFPISLQISMPAPVMPEPIITVISTSPSAPDNSASFNAPSFAPPIHVVEKSRSKWKSWLPIILFALLDCGCGNNCGGGYSGGQCGSNIPIPYPIPIPTNNPIVMECQLDD